MINIYRKSFIYYLINYLILINYKNITIHPRLKKFFPQLFLKFSLKLLILFLCSDKIDSHLESFGCYESNKIVLNQL